MSFEPPGDDGWSSTTQQQQLNPMIIMGEDAQRVQDKDARYYNITAARAVSEVVRTSLGPQGLDKMLVDSEGSVLVTNDGASVLHEMDIDNPSARLVREVSQAQAESVGDGTTTAVVLAGELLTKAEDLLDQGLHATTVSNGYQQAASRAEAVLDEIAAKPTNPSEHLLEVARSTLTGKVAKGATDHLAGIVVAAVMSTTSHGSVDTSNIDLHTETGGSVGDTSLIQGVLFDISEKSAAIELTEGISTVGLINGALTPSKFDGEYTISDPDTFEAVSDREDDKRRDLAAYLIERRADLILSTGEIDPVVRDILTDAGCTCFAELDEDVFSRVGAVTDASSVTKARHLTNQDLGRAESVGIRTIEGKDRFLIKGLSESSVATILIRGETDHLVSAVERAVEDTIAVVARTLIDGQILPGGGATEVEVARRLREYAASVSGREQLAVEAYADALEIIPRILAENAGQDPIDALVELRSEHEAGMVGSGVGAKAGTVTDMWSRGVVSPISVGVNAIQIATEAAVLILRIDDVIAAGDLAGSEENTKRQSRPSSSVDSTSVEMAVPKPVRGSVASTFKSVPFQTIIEGAEEEFGTARISPSQDNQTSTRTDDPKEVVQSISTPTWVPPKQRFPLRLSWSGTVTSVSIYHGDVFEVIDVIGDEPRMNSELGRTKITAEDLGDHGNLIVYLRTAEIPDDGTIKETPVDIEFESDAIHTETTTLTIHRANVTAEVTRQVTLDHQPKRVDIALQNSGELKALVDIEARIGGEPVSVPGGGIRNLLEGFLNIGVHRKDTDELARVDELKETKQHLLQRSCEDVSDLLQDELPPPASYTKEDLQVLKIMVKKMLEAEKFSPLKPHLDDIRLAYLEETAAGHSNGAIQLLSSIGGVDISQETETIEIVIHYEDPNGTTYDPIKKKISIEANEPYEGLKTVPVDIHMRGGD